MDPKELQALLQKAVDLGKEVKEANDKLQIKVNELETQRDESVKNFEALQKQIKDGGGDVENVKTMAKTIDDLQNEISDLRSKMKSPNQVVTPEQKEAMFKAVIKPVIGKWMRGKSAGTSNDFYTFMAKEGAEELKALNITSATDGGYAIAEVLSRDVIEYAREYSPILSLVGRKPLTRSYRELVLVAYPSVQAGIENVPGTTITETSTQEYLEVKAKEFKVNAKPRITDEAMYGTDIDLYGQLVRLLSKEISIYLAAQVLFGDGEDKNCRGILSSNRVDITDGTGESWKPTLASDPANARDANYFPVVGTGVDASLGADDMAIVDFLIKVKNTLPTMYRPGSSWTMNTNTMEVLEKVRDTQDRPIFVTSYREGGDMRLFGYPVTIDDTLPDIASDSTPIIFGRLDLAFAISDGDIDKMLIDPYTVDGCTVIKYDKEMFEIVQNSDAIIIVACTVNDDEA